jgi:hypothetical protein
MFSCWRVCDLQQFGKNRPFARWRVLATPGALQALENAGQQPQEFLDRHANGDWGEVDAYDAKENELASTVASDC